MMKLQVATLIAMAALLAVMAGCAGSEEVKEKSITLADARAMAAEKGMPVLIDFYTDW